MLVWLSSLIFLIVGTVLMLYFRYSERKIRGFPLTQFTYMFISAPLISANLIAIALEITRSSQPKIFFLPDSLLLFIIIFTVITGAIGSGIHSTSVTMSFYLNNEKDSLAYKANERIHGFISHQMLYISLTLLMPFYTYLELNHPNDLILNTQILASIGMIVGVLVGISIAFASFARFNTLVCLFCIFLSLPAISHVLTDHQKYPISVFALTTLFSLLVVLLIFSFIPRSYINRKFPQFAWDRG